MKKRLLTGLTVLMLSGCSVLGLGPELYGSLEVYNPKNQATQAITVQAEDRVLDHYTISVTGAKINPPLTAIIPPGKLQEQTSVVFDKVPVGPVVVDARAFNSAGTVLASISIPVVVEANKTTKVFPTAPPTQAVGGGQNQQPNTSESRFKAIKFISDDGLPSPQELTIRSGDTVHFINEGSLGLVLFLSTNEADLADPLTDEFSGQKIRLGANGATSKVLTGSSSSRLMFRVARANDEGKLIGLGQGYISFQ